MKSLGDTIYGQERENKPQRVTYNTDTFFRNALFLSEHDYQDYSLLITC